MSNRSHRSIAQTAHLQPGFSWFLLLGFVTLVVFWLCNIGLAHAQTASGFYDVQHNISQNTRNIPKLVAMIAYVSGVFFTAAGLLKFKDWVNDSDRNPLNAALFRLIVATLLVMLPHIFVMVNTTFWGTQANGASASTGSTKIPAPKMSVFCPAGKTTC